MTVSLPSPELLNILNSIKLNFMLPLSNGKSVLRLILIIHKSGDLKYFFHALKISWTKATYIKVSRNSQLHPNLAFGRVQRKLHSHSSPHLNHYFRAPKHKTWPHDLSITSYEAIHFLSSYPISYLWIILWWKSICLDLLLLGEDEC